MKTKLPPCPAEHWLRSFGNSIMACKLDAGHDGPVHEDVLGNTWPVRSGADGPVDPAKAPRPKP